MLNRSQTYTSLIEMILRIRGTQTDMTSVQISNGDFSRESTGQKSTRLDQDFTISALELFPKCTPAQVVLLAKTIIPELKEYNALWYCDPSIKRKNSSIKIAIRGLLEMNVLIKTETMHIYLVNPYYIRRGDFYSVLCTTAAALEHASKVSPQHIANYKPIKNYRVPDSARLLTN